MIDTKRIQAMTSDCDRLSVALSILASNPHHISVHAAGHPVNLQSVILIGDDYVAFSEPMPGIYEEVRDLIQRRLTDSIQAKLKYIEELCTPKPPTMAEETS